MLSFIGSKRLNFELVGDFLNLKYKKYVCFIGIIIVIKILEKV